MIELPTQLVCRPRPFPDEALPSYLIRVQVANEYPSLTWLTNWLRDTTGVKIPTRPFTDNNLPFLESLAVATQVPVLHLYNMTLNPYLSVLQIPGRTLMSGTLSSGETVFLCPNTKSVGHNTRPDYAVAFCPLCLQKAAYQRLFWFLPQVFACTEHLSWLRDACANCGSPVSVQSVVSGTCSQCNAVLVDMPTIPLDEIAVNVQQGLIECFQPNPILEKSLPPLSPQGLMRLLDGLCATLRKTSNFWSFFYHPAEMLPQIFPAFSISRLSTIQKGILLVSAWQAVINWPTNFYDFTDQYQKHTETGGLGMLEMLGTFYSVWLEKSWQHPDMEPVQTAFNDYFVTRFPASREIRRLQRLKRYPELQDRIQYIDVRNAARLLGATSPKIMRLVRDGYVRIYPQRDRHRPGYFVYRADLEDALQRKPEKVKLADVASEFSVIPRVISDWIQAGLLQRSGILQLHGISQPVLTTSDVEAFRRRLAHHIHVQAEKPQNAVSLSGACSCNGKVGMNSVHLLQRVLDGKLNAYHTHPDLQPFNELWFESQAVRALTEQVKIENNWMGFLEVWRLLEVSREVVHSWIERQILIPVATFARAVYFNRDAVLNFHARLMRSKEVARYLETNRSAISIWVRAGKLPVLSGLGRGQGKYYTFDCEVIADWRTRYVSSGELRSVLGEQGYQSFLKKVKHGTYAVAFGPYQCVYHRLDVESFQVILEQQL